MPLLPQCWLCHADTVCPELTPYAQRALSSPGDQAGSGRGHCCCIAPEPRGKHAAVCPSPCSPSPLNSAAEGRWRKSSHAQHSQNKGGRGTSSSHPLWVPLAPPPVDTAESLWLCSNALCHKVQAPLTVSLSFCILLFTLAFIWMGSSSAMCLYSAEQKRTLALIFRTTGMQINAQQCAFQY